jgi:hypothetical protein
VGWEKEKRFLSISLFRKGLEGDGDKNRKR